MNTIFINSKNSKTFDPHKLLLNLRITFKIKTGYYLQLLTPETMKLLGSTKTR